MIDVRSVFTARDAMLSDGEIPEHLAHRIRPDIMKSWRRSMLCGAAEQVPVPELMPASASRTALRAAADPILTRLSVRLSGLDTGVLLADHNAVILRRWVTDQGILPLMDSINSNVGFNVAEELVGTNGVGSIIEAGHAMQITGPEHLSTALSTFTCVGAPIHNPITRRLEGVITLSCMSGDGHPLLTPLLTSTAQDIEHRMLEQSSRRERLLLDAYLVASKKRRALVAAVGRDLFLGGPQVTELLRHVDQAALWEYVRATAAGSKDAEHPLEGAHDQFRVARCDAIESDGEVIGTIVEFEIPREATARSTTARKVAPRGPLPGSSAALGQSVAQATRMAEAGHSFLIEGESGVGKWTLARGVLDRADVDPALVATIDLAACGIDGPAEFTRTFRELLEKRPQALLLRHLESMSAETASTAASLLETATSEDWTPRVIATLTVEQDGRVTTPPLQRLVDVIAIGRVAVPPLRDRADDISEAATVLLGRHRGERDLRFSSAALRSLMRAPWPGNLRQLDSTIRGLASSVSRTEIHPEDLPAELQSHTQRRELTAMEQLELNAILNALRQHRGNKIAAANSIGISRSTLYRKLRAYRIDPDRQYF